MQFVSLLMGIGHLSLLMVIYHARLKLVQIQQDGLFFIDSKYNLYIQLYISTWNKKSLTGL